MAERNRLTQAPVIVENLRAVLRVIVLIGLSPGSGVPCSRCVPPTNETVLPRCPRIPKKHDVISGRACDTANSGRPRKPIPQHGDTIVQYAGISQCHVYGRPVADHASGVSIGALKCTTSRWSRRPDGLPVHSFRSLLADLATLARNTDHDRDRTTLSAHSVDPADGSSIRRSTCWRSDCSR